MRKIIKYIFIFLAIIFILLVAGFYFFFVGGAQIHDNIIWGVDFSQSQAEYLKLDWKELYSSVIEDLKVENIKLHTNWSWVEGKQDEFYFDDIDWQLQQAKENGVKIIYVIGVKTGRWPECHYPDWLNNLSEQQQKDAALNYIKQVVERYKDNNSIAFWQVENEPLLNFGKCPEWYYKDDNFLKQEVALVKLLDPSRKIIVSESGELSWWHDVAKIGDIVGVTMYRRAWLDTSSFGFPIDGWDFYATYPVAPILYARKAEIVKNLFNKKTICIELQAEPWAPGPFREVSLSEQAKTMNLDIFKDNIEYAKQTGLDAFYFWGAEWWYWMKTSQNQPEIWNEARELFSS